MGCKLRNLTEQLPRNGYNFAAAGMYYRDGGVVGGCGYWAWSGWLGSPFILNFGNAYNYL
ncbi:hypothetical protein CK934_28480 [Chitinophaga sp. MD30]|nr:hypothetical protein CK934_28480 [Chitinophaga sp. MD30]